MTGDPDMTDRPGNRPGRGPDGIDLDRVWTGVAAEVWRRLPGRRSGWPAGCYAPRAWPGPC